MTSSNQLMTWLKRRLPVLIVVFCVLQPLLDVLGYWQLRTGLSNTFTLTARIVLLVMILVLGVLLSRRRWVYLVLGLIVLAYLSGHCLVCRRVNPDYAWLEDLADQIRFLFLPIATLCFITFSKELQDGFSVLMKGLLLSFGVILLVMLLSVLTGTDPHTYEAKGIGVRGWFFWSSAQSAILSLLCPLVLAWTLERFPGRLLPLVGACLLCFGVLFLFGTRLAYASLMATGLCLAACMLLHDKSLRPQALTLLLCTAVFACLLPVSPMMRNQREVARNAVTKQQRIDAAVAGLEPGDPETLRIAYRYNLQGMVDRFGIQAVAEAYEGTLDANRICDDRLRKLRYCELLMRESTEASPLSPFFGLEIGRTRVEETEVYYFEADQWKREFETYDPENDVLGVVYLCGYLGLALCVCFLGIFPLRVLRFLRRQPRMLFHPRLAAFLIAFAIALVYACTTVSVLRRNNASVYLAYVLAGLWHLTRGPLPGLPGRKKELSP